MPIPEDSLFRDDSSESSPHGKESSRRPEVSAEQVREHDSENVDFRTTVECGADAGNRAKTGPDERAFLASIVDSTGDSIVSVNLQGVITTWNKAAERLYGHGAAEAIGAPLNTLTLPPDLSGILERIVLDKITQKDETIRVHRNGEEMLLSMILSPVKNAEGQIIGRSILARNIRAQKQSEKETLGKSEQLRMILENAREYAIFSLDLHRRITTWNSGAETILGYKEEEVLGLSADIIFTAEDRAAGAPEREADIARMTGRAGDERWHVRKDGSRFWGSGVMMPMRDASSTEIGLVKIFRDHTEEVRAKAALEKSLQETEVARSQAEAANRAKDYFFAVLSHELRAPLSPISMAAAALARRTDLPPDVLDAFRMILRNVQLQANFIEDLLDVTRIAQQKLEITKERVSVRSSG